MLATLTTYFLNLCFTCDYGYTDLGIELIHNSLINRLIAFICELENGGEKTRASPGGSFSGK